MYALLERRIAAYEIPWIPMGCMNSYLSSLTSKKTQEERPFRCDKNLASHSPHPVRKKVFCLDALPAHATRKKNIAFLFGSHSCAHRRKGRGAQRKGVRFLARWPHRRKGVAPRSHDSMPRAHRRKTAPDLRTSPHHGSRTPAIQSSRVETFIACNPDPHPPLASAAHTHDPAMAKTVIVLSHPPPCLHHRQLRIDSSDTTEKWLGRGGVTQAVASLMR